MRNSSSALEVPLVLSFDENYAMGFVALLRSIANARRPHVRFKVFAVHDVKHEGNFWIKDLVPKEHFDYVWIDANEKGLSRGMYTHGYFSPACYFRLYLGSLLPKTCARALYLDVDTLVRECPSTLFEWDLGTSTIGAVRDYVHFDAFFALPREGRVDTEPSRQVYYFNSGVMVVNLERWRNAGIECRAVEYAMRHRLKCVDQDALNAVIGGNWCELPARWNVQLHTVWPSLRPARNAYRASVIMRSLSSPAILHYTYHTKPFHGNYNGIYRFEYLELLTAQELVALGLLKSETEMERYAKANRRQHDREQNEMLRWVITDSIMMVLLVVVRLISRKRSIARQRLRSLRAIFGAPRSWIKTLT